MSSRKRLRLGYGGGGGASSYRDSNAGQIGSGGPGWLGSMPTSYPETLVMPAPTKVPQIIRQEKRLQAQETNYRYTGNNIVTFNFPNAKPIDFRDGFLFFDVVLTGTPPAPPAVPYIRIADGAWNIINRFRMIFGSLEDEIQYYNRLYSFLWTSSVDAEVKDTIGLDLLGVQSEATRNAWGANPAGTSYVLPICHGFFRRGIVPMNALSTGTNGQLLRVELTIENPNVCLESNYSNLDIQIINLRWHYTECSSADGSFEQQMCDMVRSGGYKIGFETWSVFQNPVLSSSPDIIIQWKGSALNYIVSLLQDNTVLNNPQINGKFYTWLKALPGGSQITSYQHCLNEVWQPVEPVDTTGNAYRAYLQYLNNAGYWEIDGRNLFPAPIGLESFNGDPADINKCNFMITYNAKTYWNRVWNKGELFNNVSTQNSTSNTILRLTFTSPTPANTVIFHIISNNIMFCASANGTLNKKW